MEYFDNPPFIVINNIPNDNPIDEKTPIIVSDDDFQTFDMCCLMPYVFQEAGLPLSDYYKTICEAGGQTKCFTKVPSPEGSLSYIDKSGQIKSVSDGSDLSDLLKDYFYMEYDNLQGTVK